jgi:UPF0716 protein FxsA
VIVFIFFSYIALEVYAVMQIWDHFGFLNMLFAFMLGAILGIGIVRNQGRYVLGKMQDSFVRGQLPTDQVLHSLLIFLGGLLLITPGFVNDVIGLLFVLPGSRHLLAAYLKPRLASKIKTGNFRTFTFGNMGHTGSAQKNNDGWQRDVTPKVIDVKPISVESHEKPEE